MLAPAIGDVDSHDAHTGGGSRAACGAGAAPWRPWSLPAGVVPGAVALQRCNAGPSAGAGRGGAAAPGGAICSDPRFAAANVVRVLLSPSSCPLLSPSARCCRHAVGLPQRFVPLFPPRPTSSPRRRLRHIWRHRCTRLMSREFEIPGPPACPRPPPLLSWLHLVIPLLFFET